jgi:hypothetical protein
MANEEPLCANPDCEYHKEQARFYPEVKQFEYFGKVFGQGFKLCAICHRAVQFVKEHT